MIRTKKLRSSLKFPVVALVALMMPGDQSVAAKETAGTDPSLKPTALIFQLPTGTEENSSPALRLRGADARQQLLVGAQFSSGALRDETRKVTYEASPADVVRVSETGLVTPLRDGRA